MLLQGQKGGGCASETLEQLSAALSALGSPSTVGSLSRNIWLQQYSAAPRYFLLSCIIQAYSGLCKHFFDRCVALIPIPCHARQEDAAQAIQ